MLQQTAEAILAKPRRACLLALVFSALPFFGVVSVLITGLVTLRKGALPGARVMAWALLPFAAHAIAAKSLLYFVLAATSIVMVWGFAIPLRRYASWQVPIEMSMVLGLVVVAVCHFVVPDLQQWWQVHTLSYIQQVMLDRALPVPNMAVIKREVAFFSQFATGFQWVLLVFLGFSKLLVARWWQSIAFNPGAMRKELLSIRLNAAWLLALVAILLAGWLGVSVALDVLPVLLSGYVFAGISLLHFWAGKQKFGVFLVSIFYLTTIFAPYFILPVIIMAMCDSCVNIRSKYESL